MEMVLSEHDGDRLEGGVGLEPGLAEFAALPAEPRAAPRQGRVERGPAVDRDGAGPYAAGDGVRPAQVRGPERRGQGVPAVVGDRDCLLVVVERDDRADRAEDLLAGDGHVV